jgi:hypothetical protein
MRSCRYYVFPRHSHSTVRGPIQVSDVLVERSRDPLPAFRCSPAFPIANRSVAVDPQVPAFRRSACLSMKNAAIKNVSCADSGAHSGVKEVSIATTRAPLRFRQRRGIGVVIDSYGHVIHSAHFLGQRAVMPDREIRRTDDDTSFRIQRSQGADADGCDSARTRQRKAP